eukprot:360056-Chlamydomonas_euryale.AAC.11
MGQRACGVGRRVGDEVWGVDGRSASTPRPVHAPRRKKIYVAAQRMTSISWAEMKPPACMSTLFGTAAKKRFFLHLRAIFPHLWPPHPRLTHFGRHPCLALVLQLRWAARPVT